MRKSAVGLHDYKWRYNQCHSHEAYGYPIAGAARHLDIHAVNQQSSCLFLHSFRTRPRNPITFSMPFSERQEVGKEGVPSPYHLLILSPREGPFHQQLSRPRGGKKERLSNQQKEKRIEIPHHKLYLGV